MVRCEVLSGPPNQSLLKVPSPQFNMPPTHRAHRQSQPVIASQSQPVGRCSPSDVFTFGVWKNQKITMQMRHAEQDVSSRQQDVIIDPELHPHPLTTLLKVSLLPGAETAREPSACRSCHLRRGLDTSSRSLDSAVRYVLSSSKVVQSPCTEWLTESTAYPGLRSLTWLWLTAARFLRSRCQLTRKRAQKVDIF